MCKGTGRLAAGWWDAFFFFFGRGQGKRDAFPSRPAPPTLPLSLTPPSIPPQKINHIPPSSLSPQDARLASTSSTLPPIDPALFAQAGPPPLPAEVEAAEAAARAAPALSDEDLKAAAGARAVEWANLLRSANGYAPIAGTGGGGGKKGGPAAGAATKKATQSSVGLPPAHPKLLTRPALSTASLTARLGHAPGPGDGPIHHPSHGASVHVIFTSNGSPSLNWQTRLLAATLAEVREMAYGDRLAGFTRILHRSVDDALVGDIPTFRATPLNPACDAWCEAPAADRPDAVRQFFDAARVEHDLLAAPWIYLIEPDYAWVKPVIVPLAETTGASYAYPQPYVDPASPRAAPLLRRLWPGGDLNTMPRAGPAPALLRAHEWATLLPAWVGAAAAIEADADARAALGAARDAYAFSLAAGQTRLKLDLAPSPQNILIAAPPVDEELGEAAAIHYAWPVKVVENAGRENEKIVWEWDKRSETDAALVDAPPTLPLPPGPWKEGWTLAASGRPVSRVLYDSLRSLATTLNRAGEGLGPVGGGSGGGSGGGAKAA
jgi:hydroxyproline O-arabinosyltransferase